jgi:N6-adenosine-specific RNA methylase IME4/ParB-like chromosome segregation protein Spo0J
VLNQKRAKAATAKPVDGLRDSEHAGGQLDPILTPADIREQVERDIGVGCIEVLPERLRALRPEKVEELAESIRERGLLQAIMVRPGSGATEAFWLVAGRHRFEAIKKLKLPTIRCKVRELSDDEASLVEIDENLVRADLSSIERDLHIARRKEIYERQHPDTKRGAAGGAATRKKAKGAKSHGATRPSQAFIDDTANKTGRHRATVARSAARGAALKQIPNAADAVGTSLDKQVEVEALRDLPSEIQQQLIERAKTGEKVSAKEEVEKIRREQREVELSAKIAELPDKKYGVIYADPPWESGTYNEDAGSDRVASNHYATMDSEAIKQLPIPAAEDAVLFLCTTVPMLPQALEVMAAWGFTYKSNLVWVKDKIDTGHWSRIQHEHLLIGVRGSVPAPTPGDQVASVIVSNDGMVADPRKEGIPRFLQVQNRRAGHSAKPAAFRALIETMYPHSPRIELFAREIVLGWDAWGNEVPGTLRAVS